MNYLLIAGSRDFDDAETFDRVVREYIDIVGDEAGTVIVEGGAKGVDTLAREYAEKNGIAYVEMKADWKKYGRAAGPKRNEAMTKYIFDMNGTALFFWDGKSKGTKNCIINANSLCIPVSIYRTDKRRFLK
jgi:hypothetical protein